MAKKDRKQSKPVQEPKKPSVNPELEGFDIEIDSFGEIHTSFSIDKVNEFLNKTVKDKKLVEKKKLGSKADKKNKK